MLLWRRPTLAAITGPPSQGGALTAEEAASFGAVATLTAAAGSLAGGPLADRYGRKRALVLAMIPCAVGYVAISLGSGYLALVFGRLLTGLSAGAVSVATPLYLSETSPAHLRGSLGSTMQVAMCIKIEEFVFKLPHFVLQNDDFFINNDETF